MKYFINISLLLFLVTSCERDTKRIDGFTVFGIDVSHYQADIDWQKVADQNVAFAFLKATEGITLVDSLFCKNWDEVYHHKIIRGAYHFFRPGISAELQAMNFIQQVIMQSGDLPPVLDIEVLDGQSPKKLVQGIDEWIKIVESHFDIKPIIYTNLKFYHRYLAGHFDEYPLWIARYNKKAPFINAKRNWSFWQYGDTGKLEGIEGYVDFNVFNGNLNELIQMCLEEEMQFTDLHSEVY